MLAGNLFNKRRLADLPGSENNANLAAC